MPYRPHKFRALSKPKQIHKSQHRPYWPYIPLLLLVVGAFILSTLQPLQKRGVLAYATNTSIEGLLAATNQQRLQNNASSLSLNQSLNAAAQAKANDMVTRNYWSHNTPDGQEPWVFINNAGYKYIKAGENLAYGFGTSDDTVTGWMNSPPHRENLVDTSFSDVGFGFANSPDYNSSGPETVVVAMYGKPQVLAASSIQPTPAAPVPSNTSVPSVPSPSLPQQTNTSTQEPAQPNRVPDNTIIEIPKPVSTDNTKHELRPQSISRIQMLTKGAAPWSLFGVGLITGFAMVLIFIKHATGFRHLLNSGERFVLRHSMFDVILVSLVLLGSIMSQTSGVIR